MAPITILVCGFSDIKTVKVAVGKIEEPSLECIRPVPTGWLKESCLSITFVHTSLSTLSQLPNRGLIQTISLEIGRGEDREAEATEGAVCWRLLFVVDGLFLLLNNPKILPTAALMLYCHLHFCLCIFVKT